MKTFRPFRNNVLVERLDVQTSIVISTQSVGKWIRLKVLAVGPEVKELIKPGMIVLAENMFESVDVISKNIGLILSQYIHSQEEDDGKPTN